MTIRTRVLLKSFGLAVSLLFCSASVISASSWSQSTKEHMVSGRVQIPAITHALKLAEPNQISIQTSGQRITSVLAGWVHYVGNSPVPSREDDVVLPVSYDSNGSASINVTPLKLGKVQLILFISFEDGGVERKTIDLQVSQSKQQPEKLVIVLGGDHRRDTPVLYMDLSEAYRTTQLGLAAFYKNVTSPVLLNASDVTFKLINSPGAAAEIDPSTGIVTARQVGQALLETSFGGVSTLTCIDVMSDVRVGPRSRCEELLPPGRSLPPSLNDLDKTPAPVVKARER
jgi:hypothetical protein